MNYGPGDPHVAHTAGECVSVAQLTECEEHLRAWLTTPSLVGAQRHVASVMTARIAVLTM